MYFFLLSYLIIGAGIKYMDAAFDDKTVSKKFAIIVAPLLAFLGAYAMFVDAISATILLAVLLGVLFTGKIDNIAHGLGLIVILPIIYFAGIEFLLIPLGILVLGGITDEIGNDFVDKRRQRFMSGNIASKMLVYFFEHRWTLKVVILCFVLLGMFPFYFFLAMLLFDYAYLSVGVYSDIKQGIRQPIMVREALTSIGLIFK